MAAYTTGQLDTFYKRYPSPASFPTPGVPPAGPSETEDCLFLDVMVPACLPEVSLREQESACVSLVSRRWLHGEV